MTAPSFRVLRRSALAAGCAGLVIAAGSFGPALASTSQHAKHAKHANSASEKPVVTGSRYLALGDSVPFGYREPNSIPTPNFGNAKNFVGFPEDVAANLGLKLANAACPGETTASLINAKAQSNRCENTFTKGKPPKKAGSYRSMFPLHVSYKGSQLAFAEKYLKRFPATRLVTLMIGANDAFICQHTYSDGCFSEFSTLQKKITKNAGKIFKALRDKAHYTGQIALLTYWAFDYKSAVGTFESQGLNSALEKAAKPYHVEIADGYGAMKRAAAQGRGNTCTAGLQTVLSGADKGTCGVHPSVAGAAVLAQAIERAITK
jgi:lysophospholipase L1-like esterase